MAMSEHSEHVRALFKQYDDIRDAGLPTPDTIERFDAIRYGEEDAELQTLDVYRPIALRDQKLPVIVSVHGGGWVYGDRQRYRYYCMDLAERGFSVVNFSYRLAPDAKWPAQLEDVNTVFGWVLAHAGEYGFDTDNLFATGDSAGAHMLSLYSGMCTCENGFSGYPFEKPEGLTLRAVALNCGSYTMQHRHDAFMQDLLPKGGTDEELRSLSPDLYVAVGYPPAFIMTCSGDFLTGHPGVLAPLLMKVGTPFEFHYYTDASVGEQGLGHVFHLNVRSRMGRICNDEECAFFRKYMV